MTRTGDLEIIIKEWGGSKCLFKRSRNKEGAEVESLLLDCLVVLLASNEESGEYLMRLEGANGKAIHRVAKAREISNPAAFREMVRPYSYLGGQMELEWLMMFWRGVGIKHKLVNLEAYVGRYRDDVTDFWVLADRVQWSKIAGRSLQETNVPDELIQKGDAVGWNITVRDMYMSFPEKRRVLDFVIGDRWYYVDSTSENLDLELMTKPAAEERAAEEESLEILLEKWGRLYGNVYMAYLVLGWFCGVMNMEEVMEVRGSKKFPLFALSGMTQSGKTSLIGLFMRFWGVQARPSDYTQVSTFADLKQLGMVHNVPLWRDEYRNVGRAQEKEPMLRSLYDRSSVYRGTATQELRAYKPGGTFFLSGEGVTLDPAIRRRFIYFELHQKFKLPDDKWLEAEEWAEDYAPELFYRAVCNGFDAKVFREIMEYRKGDLFDTVNAEKEERICIASLAAVYGVEIGKKIVDMGISFWQREKFCFEAIDQIRMNIAENFFTFIDSLMTMTGGYQVKELMGSTILPTILNYISVGKENVYIKLVPLVQLAFDRGFGKQTTLDQYAVKSAIKALQKGGDKCVQMGGTYSRVVAIKLEDIKDDMALSIIVDNVIMILEKVRGNGRSLGQDMEETEEIGNRGIPPLEIGKDIAQEDAFLLLQNPEKHHSHRRGPKTPLERAETTPF